mmetsp:Transcript_19430/g.61001  ORF Transcript_19430/g.61001 Transcript_19430/m.61001 type:complete len:166 (-) Transcript_19430:413-910(-)
MALVLRVGSLLVASALGARVFTTDEIAEGPPKTPAKGGFERVWPDTSKDTRGCQACMWFFNDFKAGLSLESNMDKKAFFLDNGDALVEELKGKCTSVEGLGSKHESECVTVLNKAAKNPPSPCAGTTGSQRLSVAASWAGSRGGCAPRPRRGPRPRRRRRRRPLW